MTANTNATVIVKTQEQLDRAIADGIDRIEIRAPKGQRLIACGSATVIASGSSTVHAYGSSKVTAYDSSTVHACGSSTVTASSPSAVHIKSKSASITGGVQIDHTSLNLGDAKSWCEYYGVRVIDGIAYLYKAVDNEWTTGRGWDYSPGSMPQAETWVKNGQCGDGLHFSPTPVHARRYYPDATRFVRVGVALEDLSPIIGGPPKAKAPRVVSPCVEVTLDMREV